MAAVDVVFGAASQTYVNGTCTCTRDYVFTTVVDSVAASEELVTTQGPVAEAGFEAFELAVLIIVYLVELLARLYDV